MLIYKITNLLNNKSYVGQTTRSIEERWKEHCKPALAKRSVLSKAIQKYGKENFTIEELELAFSVKELNQLEEKWVKLLNTTSPNGYNLRYGGQNGGHIEEVKHKIAIASTGRTHSKRVKKIISDTHKGKDPGNRKPVIGYNPTTGETIELPHSYADVRFTAAQIGYCCRGQRKTHKGFIWKFKV